ncbi:nitrate/nitrite transporter [Chloroflexota bacterium]
MFVNYGTTNKWYVFVLAGLTQALAIGMAESCMPVLFAEIAEDLNLSLVQIGTVWGIVPLGSVTILFIGGFLCDRFGVKRTIITVCFLAGITGAMRGLSSGFGSLVAFSFFFGVCSALIPLGLTKASRIWFPSNQLGLATSAIMTGGGIGSATAAMISATFLSPLLGGWRSVLFLYGAISVLLGIIWLVTIKDNQQERLTRAKTNIPFSEEILHVLRIRAVWLLGITVFTYVGGMRAIEGYLPIYLRESGWTAVNADGAVAVLALTATAGAIPLALLSDRIGRRKFVTVPAVLIAIVCAALLSTVTNAVVWGIVMILAIFRQATIALTVTMCMETEGVGVEHGGMAIGLIYTIQRMGVFMAPPLGNSLASIGLGIPFLFWSMLFAIGAFVSIFLVKETGWKAKKD